MGRILKEVGLGGGVGCGGAESNGWLWWWCGLPADLSPGFQHF